jgi:DNA-binding LacI/PurR family transcriptional regulator
VPRGSIGPPRVTLDDVARLAGVSKSTVSRILSAEAGKPLPYTASTQDSVRRAAQMLDYTPSKLARGLTQSRTGMIGLVIPSVEDSFFPSLTSIIETRLAQDGVNVVLANTHNDSTAERDRIEDLLSWRVDGLIIAPAQQTADAEPFWSLWRRQIPFVLIDRCYPHTPFCSVVTDDHAGSARVVEHLLALGRRRIARAGGPLVVSTNQFRHAGYVEALVRHGVPLDDRLVVEAPSTEEGGREAVDRVLRLDPKPDALYCFSDLMAAGAMEECLRRGVRIPQDLALVGYADLPYSALLRVPLTTVRQPREEIARRAAELLLSRMARQIPDEHQIRVPVELIVRASTLGGQP